MRIDRSRITDAAGRHIPVTRVAPRGPEELAEARRRKRRAEPAEGAGEPPLRKAADVRRRLDELATRVRRLAPPRAANPEAFHEERSEIARALQRLAEQV